MSTEQTSVAVIEKPKKPAAVVAIGNRGVEFQNIESLYRFAQAVSTSGLAPNGLKTPEAIVVAIQMGLEVGLTPMAALQNIAVINGRPTVWGDAQLAIVRGTGELEEFDEWFEADEKRLSRSPAAFTDGVAAVCKVKRKGYAAAEFAFSVSDAKRAGLWDKAGPWKQYPARMLKARARGFLLRDQFGDALKGILCREEAEDSSENRFEKAKSVNTDVTFEAPAESEPVRIVQAVELVDGEPVQ